MQKLVFSKIPGLFVLFGILLWVPLLLLTAHIYFEPWMWKFYAWLRYYHDDWWDTYQNAEPVILLFAFLLLITLIVVSAKNLLQCTQRVLAFITLIGAVYSSLVVTYFFSLVALGGRGMIANALHEVSGSLLSFAITVLFVVCVPLLLITLMIHLWRHRKEVHVLLSPKDKTDGKSEL